MRNDDLILTLDGDEDIDLTMGEVPVNTDYNHLVHKPQINGVELIGNKLLSELIGDVLILDGGTAEEVTA